MKMTTATQAMDIKPLSMTSFQCRLKEQERQRYHRNHRRSNPRCISLATIQVASSHQVDPKKWIPQLKLRQMHLTSSRTIALFPNIPKESRTGFALGFSMRIC
jgi:hypothetical protein